MLVVITYKGKHAVWQVIEKDNNYAVIADDFKTADEAHEWIRNLGRALTKTKLEEA